MNIYPAIDLIAGRCVRLHQGRFDSITTYDNDQLSVAKQFAESGAICLHVVDLEGAKCGNTKQLDVIKAIATSTSLQIQSGGGVRTAIQIESLLKNGVSSVVLGSIAIANPSLVKTWLAAFGSEKIVLALDVRLNNKNVPILASHGWQKNSVKNLWQLLDEYSEVSLKHVLCTDIDRDGTLSGPNIALYEECMKRFSTIQFQASGGIASMNNIKDLQAISIAAAIIGKAFYEKKFTLSQALKELQQC